jgi:hypothetical protein
MSTNQISNTATETQPAPRDDLSAAARLTDERDDMPPGGGGLGGASAADAAASSGGGQSAVTPDAPMPVTSGQGAPAEQEAARQAAETTPSTGGRAG